jgi:hypothetical protein
LARYGKVASIQVIRSVLKRQGYDDHQLAGPSLLKQSRVAIFDARRAFLWRIDMPWTRKLRAAIVLKDGARLIVPSDTRKLIMSLPDLHDHNPDWRLAGDLLLAASAGDETALVEPQSTLERAFELATSDRVSSVAEVRTAMKQ